MSNNDTLRRDLCRSTRARNLKGVEKCLRNGCNPDQIDADGLNSLHYAANLGLYDIALLLIQAGANIEAKTVPHSLRPLHYAALSGCYEIAKELLDRSAEVNSINCRGHAALHVAAIQNSLDVARLLLERGAYINAQDCDENTPLQVATKHKHIDMCRLLIEFGADTNKRDIHNMTALHLAVEMKDPELVKIILQQRSTDLSARSDFELSALHKAAQSGDMDIIKALLNKGANIDAQDKDSKTAAELAVIYGKMNVWKVLNATKELLQTSAVLCQKKNKKKKSVNLIAKLIEKGANVNASDCLCHTALGNAVQNDDSGLVKFLLKNNADCTIRIDNDRTVLHLAASRNNFNICELIVDHYAKRSSLKERLEFINASDWQGRKALHSAALKGNSSMVRFLIRSGAIYDAVDNEGHTPVDLGKELIKDQFTLVTKTFSQVSANQKDFVAEIVRTSEHVRKARRKDGYTVFCLAVEYNKLDMVTDILEDKAADADNMTTTDGLTALHIACRNGNVEIVNKLLDYKETNSLINARTIETKATALHMCANPEVARALLGHGAIYCRKDSNGMTPAESNRNEDVRKLLEMIDKAFEDGKLPNDRMAGYEALLNTQNDQKLTLREAIGGRRFYNIAKQAIMLNRR